jgi:hypothetical protein
MSAPRFNPLQAFAGGSAPTAPPSTASAAAEASAGDIATQHLALASTLKAAIDPENPVFGPAAPLDTFCFTREVFNEPERLHLEHVAYTEADGYVARGEDGLLVLLELVAKMRFTDEPTAYKALVGLERLTWGIFTWDHVDRSGVIPALVELSSRSNRDIVTRALGLLKTIIDTYPSDYENRPPEKVAEAGAGPIVVALLEPPVEIVRTQAVGVFSRISKVCGSSSYSPVPSLLRLLEEGKSKSVVAEAASALSGYFGASLFPSSEPRLPVLQKLATLLYSEEEGKW